MTNPASSAPNENVPPIALFGAAVVGALLGGLFIYAVAGKAQDGVKCFTDAWNAVSLIGGLLGGFLISLGFYLKGKQAMLSPEEVRRIRDALGTSILAKVSYYAREMLNMLAGRA